MTIDENTYVDTMFFVGNGDMDWLATLYKDGDGPWVIEQRTRLYYKDANGETDGAFDSQDKKKFNSLTAPDGSEHYREQGLAAMRDIARKNSELLDSPVHEVPIKGGGKEFLALMKDLPWMHAKTVTKKSAWEE